MSIVSKKLRASAGHHNAYCTVQVAGRVSGSDDGQDGGLRTGALAILRQRRRRAEAG